MKNSVITHNYNGNRKLCSKVINSGYETKFIVRSRARMNIALETSLAKLPIDALKGTIQAYIRPLAEQLPDKRLERVVEDMILGILGGETPVITAMARQNNKSDGESWATAKRIYRFLDNLHVPTGQFYESLYQVGCEAV